MVQIGPYVSGLKLPGGASKDGAEATNATKLIDEFPTHALQIGYDMRCSREGADSGWVGFPFRLPPPTPIWQWQACERADRKELG